MHWRPSSQRSAIDIDLLKHKLLRASRTLARTDLAASAGCAEALDEFVASAGDDRTVLGHPDVHDWYRRLKRAVAAGDAAACRRLGDQMPEVQRGVDASLDLSRRFRAQIGIAVDIDPSAPPVRAALERTSRYVETIDGSGVGAANLTGVRLNDDERDLLAAAVAELHAVWPEMADEFETFIARLVFFEGPAAIGFADFEYHGAIFLKRVYLTKEDATPISVAEELVHEASHTRLNAAHAVDPLFTNDNSRKYSSPLRPDPRPMFGVFHQMYVLSRLAELYRRKRAASDGDDWNSELEAICANLGAAFDIVMRHAELTPRGEQMVEAIRLSGGGASTLPLGADDDVVHAAS